MIPERLYKGVAVPHFLQGRRKSHSRLFHFLGENFAAEFDYDGVAAEGAVNLYHIGDCTTSPFHVQTPGIWGVSPIVNFYGAGVGSRAGLLLSVRHQPAVS